MRMSIKSLSVNRMFLIISSGSAVPAFDVYESINLIRFMNELELISWSLYKGKSS